MLPIRRLCQKHALAHIRARALRQGHPVACVQRPIHNQLAGQRIEYLQTEGTSCLQRHSSTGYPHEKTYASVAFDAADVGTARQIATVRRLA